MLKCVCSMCQNLKSTVDELDGEIIESCAFDFSSEDCYTCTLDGCDRDCAHFVEMVSVDKTKVFQCAICGVDVQGIVDMEPDKVYCVTCYLEK